MNSFRAFRWRGIQLVFDDKANLPVYRSGLWSVSFHDEKWYARWHTPTFQVLAAAYTKEEALEAGLQKMLEKLEAHGVKIAEVRDKLVQLVGDANAAATEHAERVKE